MLLTKLTIYLLACSDDKSCFCKYVSLLPTTEIDNLHFKGTLWIKITVVFHIFLFFSPETDLQKPKIQDFAIIKNQEKNPGNYCMSKDHFPHLSFYNYPQ